MGSRMSSNYLTKRMQRQTTVTAYFSSEQVLLFFFVLQYCEQYRDISLFFLFFHQARFNNGSQRILAWSASRLLPELLVHGSLYCGRGPSAPSAEGWQTREAAETGRLDMLVSQTAPIRLHEHGVSIADAGKDVPVLEEYIFYRSYYFDSVDNSWTYS